MQKSRARLGRGRRVGGVAFGERWPARRGPPRRAYPRPTNGMPVAMTVSDRTLAVSGRLAM